MKRERSTWHCDYPEISGSITTPATLDDKILSRARTYKPVKSPSRLFSKAASGFSAVALAVVLLHPAQYLGALTANSTNRATETAHSRIQFQPEFHATLPIHDQWFNLRSEVNHKNYVALCNQWRKQLNSVSDAALPDDLEDEARQHCRILPTMR